MQALHTTLPRLWLQRSPKVWPLLPLAWLYGALVGLRRLAFAQGWLASGHPGVPVVVVGNVVAGGAGKTPTTLALVQHLSARGLQVGVVSRGYGRQDGGVREVHPDNLAHEVGDEPLLIAQRSGVPVWVGASRLQAARALRQAHPEVQLLVCDDGLQHLALQRDLEICVMDERGAGNGWLLPAGPLREPWPRAVDLLLYTDGRTLPAARAETASTATFSARRTLAAEAVNGHGERRALAHWAGQPVDAVAGLARPEAFFDMLRAQGLTLAHTAALPDHANFAHWTPPASGHDLLCTEKDAVKLWRQHPRAWAVPLVLTPEAGFLAAIDAWLQRQGLWAPRAP